MTDPTRFDLDDRQRAMLAEMGVRVWWPQTAMQIPVQTPGASADAPSALAPVSAIVSVTLPNALPSPAVRAATPVAGMAPSPAAQATPVSRPVASPAPSAPPMAVQAAPLPDGVDQMDWATLQSTAATCQACTLCSQRKVSLLGMGDVSADWLVIGDHPAEEDGPAGEPFAGQSGQLLDNMLKAVGLSRQAAKDGQVENQGLGGVYITHVLQCRPPATRNPSPQELATCAPYLARQIALVQPKVILVMGRFAVQTVLQSTEPLGKLRGQVHHYQGVPVVATYHPDALLRNPADKAKAWADLVLALKVVRG